MKDEPFLDSNPSVRPLKLASLVSELVDLNEMAEAIEDVADRVEQKLLGRGNDTKNPPETSVPTTFSGAIEHHTLDVRTSLQSISDSLSRIERELGDDGYDEPFIRRYDDALRNAGTAFLDMDDDGCSLPECGCS